MFYLVHHRILENDKYILMMKMIVKILPIIVSPFIKHCVTACLSCLLKNQPMLRMFVFSWQDCDGFFTVFSGFMSRVLYLQ